jgi:hypothetical protein
LAVLLGAGEALAVGPSYNSLSYCMVENKIIPRSHMAYQISIISNGEILQIENQGEITFADLENQTIEAITISKEKDINLFLTIFISAEVKTNYKDIFSIPEIYERLGMKSDSKIAALATTTEVKTDEMQIYDAICMNKGWKVKIFIDKEEAINWLRAKE